MARDYVGWYRTKAQLERSGNLVNYRSKEIWWCSIGVNLGHEEDGKNSGFERPVLVIKKYSKYLFLGLPMTSSLKEGKFYYSVDVNHTPRSVILSQGRTMSAFRLRRRVYKLNDNIFDEIVTRYAGLVIEVPNKTDSQKTGSPRVPNGNLYPHYTKRKRNSQDHVALKTSNELK